MVPTITIAASLFLTILFVILTARASMIRQSEKIALGNGEAATTLQKVVRAHGNLTESMPAFLLLLWLLETNITASVFLSALAIIYCLARFLHAIGVSFQDDFGVFRTAGAAGTLLSFMGLIVLLALQLI